MLGRSLGNYGVVSKIGEGGMGVVYLARHATLGRPAAVKVLRPALSSNQDVVSRFFNEARAATAVRHPGIIEVYDFGFLEDRTAYIIMEYLDGESLAARIRRGRSTFAATLAIIRAIARALQAVHDHDIVHRDLKPDNVFLIPDAEVPSGDRVKLLDFGIAKLAPMLNDVHHTATGTVLGTPLYMAPEQCRGVGAVDHRADLYSLGCIAYEMLCGQPPFAVDGPGDVIARHLYFEPTPLRSLRDGVRPELERLVLRLLKKEPKARYSTAADLVRAIDELVASMPPGDDAGDFARTLPMASTAASTASETTLRSAASQAARPPRRQVRDRHLGIIAGVATVAIALVVLIIIFAIGGSHEGDGVSPGVRPSRPSAVPGNAGAPAEDRRPVLAASGSGSSTPDAGASVPRDEADPRPLAPSARGASGASASATAPSPAPGANVPPRPDQVPNGEATAPNHGPSSSRGDGPSKPQPAAAKVAEIGLRLTCEKPDRPAAPRDQVSLSCTISTQRDHPVRGVTYTVTMPNVRPASVHGPADLVSPWSPKPFDILVDVPANANAGALPVTITASTGQVRQAAFDVTIQVVDTNDTHRETPPAAAPGALPAASPGGSAS